MDDALAAALAGTKAHRVADLAADPDTPAADVAALVADLCADPTAKRPWATATGGGEPAPWKAKLPSAAKGRTATLVGVVLAAAARHPDLPDDAVAALIDARIPAVPGLRRVALVELARRRPTVHADSLLRLAESGDGAVRAAVAANPAAPDDVRAVAALLGTR